MCRVREDVCSACVDVCSVYEGMRACEGCVRTSVAYVKTCILYEGVCRVRENVCSVCKNVCRVYESVRACVGCVRTCVAYVKTCILYEGVCSVCPDSRIIQI